MTGLFGMGAGATVAAVVVIALVALALARPTGRRMLSDAVASVGRWPGLMRAELRGSAPLLGRQPDDVEDTTPDIPAVTQPPTQPSTHGLPTVERRDAR